MLVKEMIENGAWDMKMVISTELLDALQKLTHMFFILVFSHLLRSCLQPAPSAPTFHCP